MSKSRRRRHDFSSPFTLITLFLISSFILSPHTPVAHGLSSSSSSSSSNLHRRDPFQHFQYYDGAYDIRSKDYWASAAFTGVYGFAMAGAWMLCGLGFAIVLIAKNFCCKNSSDSSSIATFIRSNLTYYLLFVLVIIFSLLAMVATGFALVENEHTLQSTRKLEEAVQGAGNDARVTIHKVIKIMDRIQILICPYDESTCFLLNATGYQLGKESHVIQEFMQNNGRLIDQAIWSSYMMNLVVVSVNLLFLVAGLVLSLLHWNPGFIMIIFLCWISTMACWALSGIDFFLHNFAEDTCNALEDFNENPQNSSLSSLLPCVDAMKSQSVMVQIGQTVYTFVTELNSNINVIPKELGINEASYDHVLGQERSICDPFSGPPDFTYLKGKCPKNAIPIHDLPDILARFTCSDNEITMETCKGYGKFLPETTFLMANAYIRSVENLIDVYPYLEDLIHCSFVKDRVSDVVLHQCKPFKGFTYGLWICTLALSICMTVLVLVWVAKAYHDWGKTFSYCSIVPIVRRHEDQPQQQQETPPVEPLPPQQETPPVEPLPPQQQPNTATDLV